MNDFKILAGLNEVDDNLLWFSLFLLYSFRQLVPPVQAEDTLAGLGRLGLSLASFISFTGNGECVSVKFHRNGLIVSRLR